MDEPPFAHAPGLKEMASERAQSHLEHAIEEYGWDEIESLDEIDSVSKAFRIGRDIGAKNEARMNARHLARSATAMYFESIEGLERKLRDLKMGLFVTDYNENDCGVLEVVVGYWWPDVNDYNLEELIELVSVDKTDDGGFDVNLNEPVDENIVFEVLTTTCYPVGDGYITDIGEGVGVKSKVSKIEREFKD